MGDEAEAEVDGDVRDELPADLDLSGFVGPYQFPDNSRRRVPGIIYLVIAGACLVAWLVTRGGDPVLVNRGFLWAAVALGALGVLCLTSGWRMTVDEKDALITASRTAGFAVGHASAQLAWRGLRSRPTWRILCYSAEDPPVQRAFVMIDAVDGEVVEHVIEANPEDWAEAE
jgi:hypothetical protein